MKVWCYEIIKVDESWDEWLDEDTKREWFGHLTADLDSAEEVPTEEAVPVKAKVSNYIGLPQRGGWIVEKELSAWRWKGKLWIEMKKFEEELC